MITKTIAMSLLGVWLALVWGWCFYEGRKKPPKGVVGSPEYFRQLGNVCGLMAGVLHTVGEKDSQELRDSAEMCLYAYQKLQEKGSLVAED